MSFEEEFDSIIRRKAEEENYPFEQSSWDKASGLLDAEREALRAAKWKQIYLPATLAVVLGALGFAAYNYFTSAEDQNKEIAVVVKSSPTLKASGQEKVQSVPAKNVSSANAADHIASNNTAEASQMALSSREIKAAAFEGNPESVQQARTTIKAASTKLPTATLKDEEQELAMTEKGREQEPFTADHDRNTSTTNGNEHTDPPSDGIADVSPKINPSERSNSSTEESNSQQKEASAAPESQLTLNSSETMLSADYLNAEYATLPLSELGEGNLIFTPFTYLKRYDDDYYKNGRKAKTHYLNVEAGANYLLGWDAKNGKDGQGMNWYGGINYGFYLCHKTSLSLGLQAYNIANIKQPFYLVSSKEYGFGSIPVYTRVTSNQLYYVALPLKFNYHLNSANVIGFGLNAGYLVGARNTVSKYYVLDNEEKSIDSDARNKDIYKGTNMYNLMLSAHYRTQFGNRLGMNLEFNYGLSDLFGNSDNIKTREKPMAVRVGLTYTLFDK